jgi:hypothetical protein
MPDYKSREGGGAGISVKALSARSGVYARVQMLHTVDSGQFAKSQGCGWLALLTGKSSP